tara:strand:- start:1134 stop:1322 length:189 start_codon:yes stop_codon:yes gene_type:complete
MNNFLKILPLIISIVLFFLLTIAFFKYKDISFEQSNDHILKRVVTVETLKNNNNLSYNNYIG